MNSAEKARQDIRTKRAAVREHLGRRSYFQWVRLALAVSIVALVYFYRLDRPTLWGDEADTGILARNTLHTGYPVAYDGRNVTVYQNGTQLNRNLVCRRIPWGQYYLGALSMAIFGHGTGGLRIGFALAGLLSLFPIYGLLKNRVRHPLVITVLALTAPQVVLFQRNARYYPILVLLYALLVWHLDFDFQSCKVRRTVATLILIAFFHTHPLAAGTSCLSLLLFCLCFRREAFAGYACAALIGFLSWLAWYELLGAPLARSRVAIFAVPATFSSWFGLCAKGTWAALADLDRIDCLPLLLWLAVLGGLVWRGRKAVAAAVREPLVALVFGNLLIQALASTAVVGVELGRYSLLRYMPHLLVFALISGFVALDSLPRWGYFPALLGLFAAAGNFLTLSYWTAPSSNKVPVSWVAPVYAEIFQPRPCAWDAVLAKLRREARHYSFRERDKTIVAEPDWVADPMIFYLGDRYRVTPPIRPPGEACREALYRVLGAAACRRLFALPEWIVDMREVVKTLPKVYVLSDVIPSNQTRPDDGNRPELTMHCFPQTTPVRNVRLFRLQPGGR
jgi:hypothetical protein